MLEILICKNGDGFWDRKLVNADPAEVIKNGVIIDGHVLEVRKIHAAKEGVIRDFLYAVYPGTVVTEGRIKNALGIPPSSE